MGQDERVLLKVVEATGECPLCGGTIDVTVEVVRYGGESDLTTEGSYFASCGSADCQYEYVWCVPGFDGDSDGNRDAQLIADVVERAVDDAECPNIERLCEHMGVEPWELLGAENEEE